MKIAVIDGQGGGIGFEIISQLRALFPEDTTLFALGTNAAATSRMMKAKATQGATGENAIICTVARVDLIIGTLDLLIADSLMGEITASVSAAIARSSANKILLPMNRAGVEVVTSTKKPLPHLFEDLEKVLREHYPQTWRDENVRS